MYFNYTTLPQVFTLGDSQGQRFSHQIVWGRGSPPHSLWAAPQPARQGLMPWASAFVFWVMIETITFLGIYSWLCFSAKPSQSSAHPQQSHHHIPWCWFWLGATEMKGFRSHHWAHTQGTSYLGRSFFQAFLCLAWKTQHISSRKSSYSHIKKPPYSKINVTLLNYLLYLTFAHIFNMHLFNFYFQSLDVMIGLFCFMCWVVLLDKKKSLCLMKPVIGCELITSLSSLI